MAAHRSRSAVRARLRVTSVLAVALIGGGLVPPIAAAAGDPTRVPGPVAAQTATPGQTKAGYSRLISDAAVLQPGLAAGGGRHTVFVQLATRGAAAVSAALLAGNQGAAAARRAVAVQRVTTRALATAVSAVATAVDPGAVTVFEVANAVPGVGLTADSAALQAVAALADVVRISEIVPKTPANTGAAQLTKVLQTWTDLGVTGRGVRIGVIDTGIDYTHADFGGQATPDAYSAARATDSGPWVPTAKVVGGYDFVGDDYDAAAQSAAGTPNPSYQPIPHPDANPLDCNGHGTHVAGTIAGSGVTADGATFTGDYARLSGADLNGMDIAPGMAPQASLYPLKVFGCSGATDQVIPALDWALDPNGDGDFSDRLDVLDLSLSSTVAATDDPENTVLDSLAQFGVLPVVAIGNTGDQTDAASSLAGSVRSLAVASSVDAYQQPDGTYDALPGSVSGRPPGVDQSITDLLEASSSRGPHGSSGPVKPDVSAPGYTVESAMMGTGAGSSLRSGTSMASAEIAGIAALVRERNPYWTPEQAKAAVMNTADHDVYTQAGRSGPVLGPDRVGSGRVDARSAMTTQLLAYSASTPGAVSVTFGVVPAEVGQPTVTTTSAVVVQNTGNRDAQLDLRYEAVLAQSGVDYQVRPTTMTLPAGASALATVTMTVTPTDLRHTLDPGTPAQQQNPLTGLDEARSFVSAASGRIVITAANGSSLPGATALRVPVFGAAKPVSSTTAADGTVAGSPAVVLSGTGFALSSPADPASAGYTSLTSVLDLGYRSSTVPGCRTPAAAATGPTVTSAPATTTGETATCTDGGGRAGDIQAVGAGRAGLDGGGPGYLWFGLSTYADWSAVGRSLYPTVNIDTNGDNTADFTVQVQNLPGSDLLYALLFRDVGAGSLISIHPVNFNLGNVDTNPFDTNVMLIPVDPTALGFQVGDRSFPIRYSVATYTGVGAPQNDGRIDTTPAITYDLAQPDVTTAAPLWQDQGNTGIPYRLAGGVSSADALVLHLHGADGARAQVLTLSGGYG